MANLCHSILKVADDPLRGRLPNEHSLCEGLLTTAILGDGFGFWGSEASICDGAQ